jgi:XTP/dITP diphosphohydrolase
MKDLILATHNPHKAEELKAMLPQFNVKTLADLKMMDDIPETAPDLEGNSFIKATTIFEKFGGIVVADDSGLEVNALSGAPGVHSARYAGKPRNDTRNTEKLLHALLNKTNRNAQFRTVITLMSAKETRQFEGIVKGTINTQPKGSDGFGYDPVFTPEGYDKTFAEISQHKKNSISHRANAIKRLVAFLNEHPTFC